MTNNRRLREPFRHIRWHNLRQRVGLLPVISAAAIGAAAIAVVPVSQALNPTGDAGPDQAAVADASPMQSESAVGERAKAGGAAKPDMAKTNTSAAKPAETKPADPKPAETKSGEAKKATKPAKSNKAAPAKKELYYQYGVQTTGWYCGPAATRMALTARGLYPSQDALAGQLGTTINGTNSSADIARVLNAMTRTSVYQVTSIPTKTVSKRQVEKLRADVVDAISQGYPVVMNTAGSGTDVNGNTYSFPGGHYIVVVGYQYNGTRVKIADSANPNAASYWINTSNLAEWAGTRGYAS
jgi:Peptidase_C39 like family